MNASIEALSAASLEQLPEWGSPPFSCKYCLYWEDPQARIDFSPAGREARRTRKRAWLEGALASFGACGKVLSVEGRPAGYAQYAPAELLPNASDYPAGPPSQDAVLLACLFLPDRQLHKAGLGSRLLESVVEELRRRGAAALETFARRGNAENPSGPLEFYLRRGFAILREDAEFPLLRLDLRP